MTGVSEVLATTVALCPPLRSYPHLGGLSLSPSKFERCDFYHYAAYTWMYMTCTWGTNSK